MDYRERQQPSGVTFDHDGMVILVDREYLDEFDPDDHVQVLRISAIYSVCPTCNGKGTHVMPSIDGHGISEEEFDADPDFREQYLGGDFDVPCNECKNRRVVLIPKDEDSYGARVLREMYAGQAAFEDERAAERSMGA